MQPLMLTSATLQFCAQNYATITPLNTYQGGDHMCTAEVKVSQLCAYCLSDDVYLGPSPSPDTQQPADMRARSAQTDMFGICTDRLHRQTCAHKHRLQEARRSEVNGSNMSAADQPLIMIALLATESLAHLQQRSVCNASASNGAWKQNSSDKNGLTLPQSSSKRCQICTPVRTLCRPHETCLWALHINR